MRHGEISFLADPIAQLGPLKEKNISKGTKELRVNDGIGQVEVLLIDDQNEKLGIVPTSQALELAQQRGLDLVEVAPNASPPVAKLLDYGKYRYRQERKDRTNRKNQRSGEVKEVRFRPVTSDQDIDTKLRRMSKFLAEGSKVKATVRMRGRERVYPELAAELLDKVVTRLSAIGHVENPIASESNGSFAVILVPGAVRGYQPPGA